MLTSAEELGQARTSEKVTKPRHSPPTSLLFCSSSLPVRITFSGQRERFARSEVPWKPSEQRWGRYRSTPLIGKVPVVNGTRNYIVLERHGQNGCGLWSSHWKLKPQFLALRLISVSGVCVWVTENTGSGVWHTDKMPQPSHSTKEQAWVLHDEGLTRGMLCYAFSVPATRGRWWCFLGLHVSPIPLKGGFQRHQEKKSTKFAHQGFEPVTLRSRVQGSTAWAIQFPHFLSNSMPKWLHVKTCHCSR